MKSSKQARRSWMVLPVLIGLAGCENNEARVDTTGTTTAPGAAASSEDAMKQASEIKPGAKGAAAKGYPGASRRP
jgi:hypothetical protein